MYEYSNWKNNVIDNELILRGVATRNIDWCFNNE